MEAYLELGANPNKIVSIKDATIEDCSDLFAKFNGKLAKHSQQKKRTAVFIYYAGHGMMKNYTYAVLNEDEKKLYPLEKMMRALAKRDNVYVVGIFDCCREEFSEADFKEATRSGFMRQATGVGEDDLEARQDVKGSFCLTFGCPPSRGTPQKSTLAVGYFDFLR